MSAVMPPASDLGAMSDVSSRLAFFKNLQGVTTKIHATTNIDEIMLELSQEISALFNADRLTIYVLGDDKSTIVSKVKTGLNSFKDLKLPIAEHSMAGYAALYGGSSGSVGAASPMPGTCRPWRCQTPSRPSTSTASAGSSFSASSRRSMAVLAVGFR